MIIMKIVLLGDSIRQSGYGRKVPVLLGGAYTVWQPEENCRFAQHTLWGIKDWAKDMEGAEVVHWNNGHWDTCEVFGDGPFTPVEQYVDTMMRIARILKSRHGKVIFATSTPVREGNERFLNRNVIRYNEALVPVLADMGIQINDLYSAVSSHVETYIRADDSVHLTEAGADFCADLVAKAIRKSIFR